MNKPACRTFLLGALVAGAIASPGAAWAAPLPLALLPPTGDNVAPSILQASREILKDHLSRSGAYVVLEAGEPTGREPSPAEASERARAVGAEQAIVLRITHIGTTARVRLTAYAAGSGQTVYWDSIVVTGGPDELDVSLQRLARAMEIGKPVRDSAELETVTEKEAQGLNRRSANKSFGVRIFALLPVDSAGDSFDGVPGGGLFWLYDARSWMADIAVDLGGQGGRAFYDLSLGAYYPFLREDFTPYLGGALRWAYTNFGGQGASGIIVQPTFGVLLGRISSVQMRGEVGYFFSTFGEREAAPVGSTVATTLHRSHGVVINAGIGF